MEMLGSMRLCSLMVPISMKLSSMEMLHLENLSSKKVSLDFMPYLTGASSENAHSSLNPASQRLLASMKPSSLEMPNSAEPILVEMPASNSPISVNV